MGSDSRFRDHRIAAAVFYWFISHKTPVGSKADQNVVVYPILQWHAPLNISRSIIVKLYSYMFWNQL